MKKKLLLFMMCIAYTISGTLFAVNPGDTITLNLGAPINPPSFQFDEEKGQWTETFNDEDYGFIEFEPFAFSHLIGGSGSAMGGYYWDGFTVCSSGDNANYADGGSQGWVANQWGNMAGGGIKTGANGKIMTDENQQVITEQGIPYLLAYWGYFMESQGTHCLQTIFNDGNTYEAVGMYVNNHPWPYYGNMYGDGFASAFTQEGDYFKLIIHALDENYEDTGKTVEHMLAEFKNGALIQSDKWEWVDLSSLGEIGGLYYTMESSDSDPIWGPNTAVYFCMDKLQVRVPGAAVPTVDVSIAMNSTSKTMVLKNKATNMAVEAGTPSGNKYNFTAEPGEYTLYAYDGTTLNGTIDLTITDDETQSFQFYTVTTYASNSGWNLNSDYSIEVRVTSRGGILRSVTTGKTSSNANRATFLVQSGDTYYVQLIPNEEHAEEGYLTFNGSGTVTFNTSKSGAIPIGYAYTLTVPEGASSFIGQKGAHFQAFTGTEALSAQTENGKTIYNYKLANNQQYNYRISQPGKVTYAGIFTMSSSTTGMEITADMLEGDPKEIDRDVTNNKGYNVADILLNINEKGHLKLNSGDTHQIVNVRTWQTTDGISSNYFIEPDYHYTVINENGDIDNNVITVSETGKINAINNGTAIVLVTYDAINVTSADGGPFFGAIWPENTGVFVVSVGNVNTDIESNMTINESYANTDKLAGKMVDAELDVFYYASTENGYNYTFTPENATSVTMAQPIVGENMTTYSGFSTSNVTDNGDGSYTLKLKQGRNIIKLSSETGSDYQVLTAKALSYTVTNNSNPEQDIKPGDNISIRFNTIYHPTPKLAGIYNMQAALQYEANGEVISGVRNQYTFASNANAQTISVTIPEDWNENEIFEIKNGVIKSTFFGDPFGSHRNITLEAGRNPNFTAVNTLGYFGALPAIGIDMKTQTIITDEKPEQANMKLSVYPNPFADYIMVETNKDSNAVIYNISGQAVMNAKVTQGSNYISTSSLSKGTYVLKCNDETIKIVK